MDNTVSVIDTATNSVTATIVVGDYPSGVAVNPSGTSVYVANYYISYNEGTVSVIDTATNSVTATIPVGKGPKGVAVNPSGTRVYVTNYMASTVSVIDTATNSVAATIPVGFEPIGVAVNPSGTRVYVTNYYFDKDNKGTVSVIDTATNSVTATIPVGLEPGGVAVNPSGTSVYVANYKSNTVSVIETATNNVTATIPVGNGPAAFGNFIGVEPTTTTTTTIKECTYGSCETTPDCTAALGPGWICRNGCCENVVCPASLALEGDKAQLDAIRHFRDEVLSQTPEGQEIIKLYYQWSPVIVQAMEEDEEFKEELKEMIDGIVVLITEEVK